MEPAAGYIRLHNMILHTNVLGPHIRCAVWLQGCHRNCRGCMSGKAKPLQGGQLARVDEVCESIARLNDIEGITISGGEPFLQIDALHELLRKIRGETPLGVIIYTGYYLDELKSLRSKKIDEILSGLADIVIDGPYIDTLNDGKSLKGSSNQTVNFLTDRYRDSAFLYEGITRNVELRVTGREMFFIGIPDEKTLASWKKIAGKDK